MNNSKQVLYGLECGHAAPGPPTLVNGSLQCVWCQERQTITDIILYEWQAKCLRCNFARWAGLFKQNAEIFARGHISRNRGHEAVVQYARNPDAVRTSEKFDQWKAGKSA